MIIRKPATLERFEGKQAILQLENGQQLSLSKEELGTVVQGEKFVIQIMPANEAKIAQDELARVLLNQILHDPSETNPTSET